MTTHEDLVMGDYQGGDRVNRVAALLLLTMAASAVAAGVLVWRWLAG